MTILYPVLTVPRRRLKVSKNKSFYFTLPWIIALRSRSFDKKADPNVPNLKNLNEIKFYENILASHKDSHHAWHLSRDRICNEWGISHAGYDALVKRLIQSGLIENYTQDNAFNLRRKCRTLIETNQSSNTLRKQAEIFEEPIKKLLNQVNFGQKFEKNAFNNGELPQELLRIQAILQFNTVGVGVGYINSVKPFFTKNQVRNICQNYQYQLGHHKKKNKITFGQVYFLQIVLSTYLIYKVAFKNSSRFLRMLTGFSYGLIQDTIQAFQNFDWVKVQNGYIVPNLETIYHLQHQGEMIKSINVGKGFPGITVANNGNFKVLCDSQEDLYSSHQYFSKYPYGQDSTGFSRYPNLKYGEYELPNKLDLKKVEQVRLTNKDKDNDNVIKLPVRTVQNLGQQTINAVPYQVHIFEMDLDENGQPYKFPDLLKLAEYYLRLGIVNRAVDSGNKSVHYRVVVLGYSPQQNFELIHQCLGTVLFRGYILDERFKSPIQLTRTPNAYRQNFNADTFNDEKIKQNLLGLTTSAIKINLEELQKTAEQIMVEDEGITPQQRKVKSKNLLIGYKNVAKQFEDGTIPDGTKHQEIWHAVCYWKNTGWSKEDVKSLLLNQYPDSKDVLNLAMLNYNKISVNRSRANAILEPLT